MLSFASHRRQRYTLDESGRGFGFAGGSSIPDIDVDIDIVPSYFFNGSSNEKISIS